MSVTSTHPDYDDLSDVWETCRDVADGTRALRAKTVRYLPKLTGEDAASYRARLNRTVLYNATWRTIMGFQGLLFRKPAVITVPPAVNAMIEDITGSGISLRMLALEITEECLTVSRVGLWVNYPKVDRGAITRADAIRLNLRPTMRVCKAEEIYNWRSEVVNNKMQLTQVRLREKDLVAEDEFTWKDEDRYRVLDLVDGIYRVRRFKVDDAGTDVQIGGDEYPVMGGRPMNFIPFYFISPDDVTPDIDEPIFIDLIDVNLAHFQLSADYEHGCHWSGLPTPVITGHSPKPGETLKIGGPDAIVLPNPEARATMLEVGTQGFSALEKNLDRKEAQMVVLGARLLEVQKPGIEAAETALIHRSGEQSILASMAQSISIGITAALKTLVEWANVPGEVSISLNTDFFNSPMSAEMLNAVVNSWQKGAISSETRFKALQKGEMYPPDARWEDEESKLTPVADATQPPEGNP
jgi:hypothetical protein